MTDNTMAKRKSTKGQTTIYKTWHIKLCHEKNNVQFKIYNECIVYHLKIDLAFLLWIRLNFKNQPENRKGY